ncbi:hypothetical protein ACJ72_08750, partial [Emergomyces africanus]
MAESNTQHRENGPGVEFADPVRRDLIGQLDAKLSAAKGSPEYSVSPHIWAALWLSDVENLQRLLSAEPSLLLFAVGTSSTGVLNDVLKPWNQRARARSTTSSPSYSAPSSAQSPSTPEHQRPTSIRHAQATEVSEPEPEPFARLPTSQPRSKRSKIERHLCSLRDHNRCVLTHAGMVVEVAHIYPYSMSSVPRSSSFWTTLELYWSEERINQWKAAVFGEKGGEACSNLLTLAPSVHAYWGRALFALKPLDVSDDGKSME